MDTTPFHSRINVSEVTNTVQALKNEFAKIIVGQHAMIDLMLAGILADGHILIEGVPGVAKTLAAKILARTINANFSRIQFTPDLMPSDVLGTSVFNSKTMEFEFKKGPVFTNILLIDEINRAPAKTQSALFEVMEERQISMDGETYHMSEPFLVLATQNPIEQEGTYRLPEAQLDRFLFKIQVKYPSLEEEIRILSEYQSRKGTNNLNVIEAVVSAEQIQNLRQIVKAVHVEPRMFQYIASIIQETRRSGDVYLGASPRASVFLLNAAKAIAVMSGRDFITPEDVKFMALPVLRHRIVLTPEKEMEGFTEDDVIQKMMDKIEVPR